MAAAAPTGGYPQQPLEGDKAGEVPEASPSGSALFRDLGLQDFENVIKANGYEEDDIKELTGGDLDEFLEVIGVHQAGIKLKVKKKLRLLQQPVAPDPPVGAVEPPPQPKLVRAFTAGKQHQAKQLQRMGKDASQIAEFLEVSPIEVGGFLDKPKGSPAEGSKKMEERTPEATGGRTLEIYSQPPVDASVARARNTKTIVVVGETGAGKSTMLNAMLNFCEGVNFEDDFRYELVDERKLQASGYGGAKSLTQDCIVYTMYCKHIDKYIRIVDTPGFKDVEGVAKDEKITLQIKSLFKNELEVLDYVCICVPAPSARLTGDQAYVFGRLMSIFGKDLEKRIIFLITFCDAGRPQCIKALEEAKLPINRFFKFNNSALMETDGDSMTEQFWEMGFSSQKEFFTMISVSEPISLRMTGDVMDAREMLLKQAGMVEYNMRNSLAASDRLRGLLQQLAKNEAAINANQNVLMPVQEEKQHTNRVGPNHTYCQNCSMKCHENCAFGDGGDKQGCAVMSGGYCTKCPKKCHWAQHNNFRDIETKRWTETKYVQSSDLVKLLDKSKSDKSATDQLIDKFKTDLLATLSSVGTNVVQMRTLNQKLDQIALKKQPFTDFSFFDQLITEEKMSKKPGYLERIEGYEQYKQRMKMTMAAETGAFDVGTFVKLNNDEMGKLGVTQLQELDKDPAKKKKALDEGKCVVS